MPSRGAPFRVAGYPRFYAAATIARLSNEMFAVAVVLFVLDRTGSAALAGGAAAAYTFPSLVSGAVLGAWLDRRRSRVAAMRLDQAVGALALAGIAITAGRGPDWTILALAATAGVTHPLSTGGFTSLITALVPDEILVSANVFEAVSFNLAIIAGPALAGGLAAVAGPLAAVICQASLKLVALALVVGLREPEPDRRRPGASLAATVRAGLRQLLVVPELLAATVAGALSLLGRGLLVIGFPLLAVETLGSGEEAAGLLWACFAAGSMLGALALPGALRRWPAIWVVLGGIGLSGALTGLWPVASSLAVVGALVVLSGLAYGPALAATVSVRQQHTPPELRGQVFMTAVSLKTAAFAIGAALAGPVVLELGARDTLLVVAAVQVVAAASGALLWRNSRRSGRFSA